MQEMAHMQFHDFHFIIIKVNHCSPYYYSVNPLFLSCNNIVSADFQLNISAIDEDVSSHHVMTSLLYHTAAVDR